MWRHRSFARACDAAAEKIALVKSRFTQTLHDMHSHSLLNLRRYGDDVTLRGLDYARVMEEEEEVGSMGINA